MDATMISQNGGQGQNENVEIQSGPRAVPGSEGVTQGFSPSPARAESSHRTFQKLDSPMHP